MTDASDNMNVLDVTGGSQLSVALNANISGSYSFGDRIKQKPTQQLNTAKMEGIHENLDEDDDQKTPVLNENVNELETQNTKEDDVGVTLEYDDDKFEDEADADAAPTPANDSGGPSGSFGTTSQPEVESNLQDEDNEVELTA